MTGYSVALPAMIRALLNRASWINHHEVHTLECSRTRSYPHPEMALKLFSICQGYVVLFRYLLD
jgi:thiamine biosynthesis lipoprotein ApbE